MGLLALLFLARGIGGLRLHNSGTDSDSISELWEGMDVVDNQVEMDSMRSDVRLQANISIMLPKRLPKLQILGMFDSGTNLLGALLKKNLGAEMLNQMCPGSNEPFFPKCHFWKHTPPQNVNWHDQRGLRMIALVRSPLAQFSSWIKAPYDLHTCMEGVDWLEDQNITCTVEEWKYGKAEQVKFHGPTEVWNAYTRGYHDLAAEGARIKIVEYENLVLNTEEVVRDIGTFLGVQIGAFQQILEPAKGHGRPVGRELAMRKIRGMAYMKQTPWSDAQKTKGVCQNLDTSMMEHHRVRVSHSEERLYKSDCDWPAFSFS
jgi:hypothetical protein